MQASLCAPFKAHFLHPQLEVLTRVSHAIQVTKQSADPDLVMFFWHFSVERQLDFDVRISSTDIQKRHDHISVLGPHVGNDTYPHGQRAWHADCCQWLCACKHCCLVLRINCPPELRFSHRQPRPVFKKSEGSSIDVDPTNRDVFDTTPAKATARDAKDHTFKLPTKNSIPSPLTRRTMSASNGKPNRLRIVFDFVPQRLPSCNGTCTENYSVKPVSSKVGPQPSASIRPACSPLRSSSRGPSRMGYAVHT